MRIVECAQDRFAVRDRQREHLRLKVVSLLELLGRFIEPGVTEQSGEREHVGIGHKNAGERHQSIICSYGRHWAEVVPGCRRRHRLAGPVLGVLVPLPSWGRDWVAGSAVFLTAAKRADSLALAPPEIVQFVVRLPRRRNERIRTWEGLRTVHHPP